MTDTATDAATTTLSKIDTAIKTLPESPSSAAIDSILKDIAAIPDYLDRRLKTIALKKATGLGEGDLAERLKRITVKVEEKPAYTAAQKTAAYKLLRSPTLVDDFLNLCHLRYRGRDTALLAVKTATMSRRVKDTVSVLLTGQSSEGKSDIFKTVLATCDPTTFEDYSHVSAKYLLYRQESLAEKIIVFNELNGATAAAEIIRTALSEGHISNATVNRDATGALVACETQNDTNGLVILSTWTGYKPDHEFGTRILVTEISHDDDLTGEIFMLKAKEAGANVQLSNSTEVKSNEYPIKTRESVNWTIGQRIEEEFILWQCAGTLIKSETVCIPFAGKIAEAFPRNQARFHRDFAKALSVIKVSALWHQYQRDKNYRGEIISTDADYAFLLRLSSVFNQNALPVPEKVIDFLKTVKANQLANRKALISLTGLEDWTIRRYVRQAIDAELLEVDGRGESQTYKVLGLPTLIDILPSKDKIFQMSNVQLSKTPNSIGRVGTVLNKGISPMPELDIQTVTFPRTSTISPLADYAEDYVRMTSARDAAFADPDITYADLMKVIDASKIFETSQDVERNSGRKTGWS
jgi:hypothetical protein